MWPAQLDMRISCTTIIKKPERIGNMKNLPGDVKGKGEKCVV
jgi:hypothetical protein